jgi:hypothetical protein
MNVQVRARVGKEVEKAVENRIVNMVVGQQRPAEVRFQTLITSSFPAVVKPELPCCTDGLDL